MVFTGHMGYPPNIVAADFLARRLLPLIREGRPEAHVVIVGRLPSSEVLQLGELDGVEVTGEVPDVRPWLASAQVFVCPMLSGTGIKNKLLEAMASELPCVATPLALQGFDVTPGEQLLVGETADAMSACVLELMNDDAAARNLGRSARDYVSSRHSWAAVARAYEQIYREVQVLRR
jgi:glycosyltransferase involved in cell wall biosynthesis